jgi:hypothetical protein
MKNIMPVCLLAALPLFATEPPKPPSDFQGPATMCNGRYALCIKAPCEKTPDANNNVRCSCAIEDGWSMGPNTCEERAKSLTSTYSNAFNGGSRTTACPQPINWAWCYGASCEKDNRDPKRNMAVCTCPVKNSLAVILITETKCPEASKVCSEMWSAAYPAESTFANNYFAWWMNDHGMKSMPPAETCAPR